MNLVFDSCALIAYLHKEPGADVAEGFLLDDQNTCFAHAVNLCEVYYQVRRIRGETLAHETLAVLRRAGLITREDMDERLWRQAGQTKADLARISLADCFCLALANRIGAEVVTSDHHEFDKVAEHGLCKVRFIR